jgi:tyrosyl-tRNA synthetase
MRSTPVYALVYPLITADGTKFGKTEGGLRGSTRSTSPTAEPVLAEHR